MRVLKQHRHHARNAIESVAKNVAESLRSKHYYFAFVTTVIAIATLNHRFKSIELLFVINL